MAYFAMNMVVKNCVYTFRTLFGCRSFQTCCYRYLKEEDKVSKTSVSFITDPKDKAGIQKPSYITRYGPKGFVIKGFRVFGSLVIIPGLILHWKVSKAEEITAESLELFHIIDPALDILVIGTGDKVVKLHDNVYKIMKDKGIALEVQDTANACATHNFLLDERRLTAAALIPPTSLVK